MNSVLSVAVLSVSPLFSSLLADSLNTRDDMSVVYRGVISAPVPPRHRTGGTTPAQVAILDFDINNPSDLQTAAVRRRELGLLPVLVFCPSLSPEGSRRLQTQGFPVTRRRPDLGNLTTTEGTDPIHGLLAALLREQPAGSRGEPAPAPEVPPLRSPVPPRPSPPPRAVGAARNSGEPQHLVLIGASTGGPQAVRTVLETLPPDPRWTIAIVQHIGPGFSAGFAQWLREVTDHHARIAEDGDAIVGGDTVIAPGDRHLIVRPRRFALSDAPKRLFQRPSVNELFDSGADAYRERVIAILLTGMGQDGGEGCVEVIRHGGRTLVQDEATSVVYGMPRAAITYGAASEVLPLERIGSRALLLLNR